MAQKNTSAPNYKEMFLQKVEDHMHLLDRRLAKYRVASGSSVHLETCKVELKEAKIVMQRYREEVRKLATDIGAKHNLKYELNDMGTRIDEKIAQLQQVEASLGAKEPPCRIVGKESTFKIAPAQLLDPHAAQELVCALCNCVASCEPKLTRCSHLFCGDCIAGAARSNTTLPCPVCGEMLNVHHDMQSVRLGASGGLGFLWKVLSAKKVSCGNSITCKPCNGTGCKWVGDTASYKQHMQCCKHDGSLDDVHSEQRTTKRTQNVVNQSLRHDIPPMTPSSVGSTMTSDANDTASINASGESDGEASVTPPHKAEGGEPESDLTSLIAALFQSKVNAYPELDCFQKVNACSQDTTPSKNGSFAPLQEDHEVDLAVLPEDIPSSVGKEHAASIAQKRAWRQPNWHSSRRNGTKQSEQSGAPDAKAIQHHYEQTVEQQRLHHMAYTAQWQAAQAAQVAYAARYRAAAQWQMAQMAHWRAAYTNQAAQSVRASSANSS